ncbi:LysE family translocator [Clostridium sp. UBA5119]|uniref:LysE family translocator n=1 Tax=Clostridium sp. UBA5119 TaxID=1946366 RepID=UPI0032169A88
MLSTIIAMCVFSFSMSISPGPVNMITRSSSASYGFRKSLAFVSGATISFTLLLAAIGLGVSNLKAHVPLFYEILKYVGAGFIGYMGYKIIISNPEIELKEEKLPLSNMDFLYNCLTLKHGLHVFLVFLHSIWKIPIICFLFS